MVRNTTGGSRHKKQARKNHNASSIHKKTRLKDAKEDCEMYAIVSKNFGQGNCEVLCNDGEHRICVIRNKFKGRNKRNNMIDIGVRVLAGLRDWEVRAEGKMEKCDLLEVYNNREFEDLKKDPNFNATLLRSDDEKLGEGKGGSSGFEFNYGTIDESNEVVGSSSVSATKQMDELEEINIDDI